MPVSEGVRASFILYLLQNQKAEQNSSTSQIRVGVLQLYILITVAQLPLHAGIAALGSACPLPLRLCRDLDPSIFP